MSSKVKSIVKAIVDRDSPLDAETLVIASHIRQMQMWIVRQGLNFYPKQDDLYNSRRHKIEEIVDYNRLDLYWYGIVSLFLATGSLLWYLRPSGTEAYEIHWYQGGDPNDSSTAFKAYFKPGGRELQEVIIRYSYEDYSPMGQGGHSSPLGNMTHKKWIRLRITAETITQEHYTVIPSLFPNNAPTMQSWVGAPFKTETQVNTLGFIPCVVSSNQPIKPGDAGQGEFDFLTRPIEAEDQMRTAMIDNVFTFSNGTLVTTRPSAQVMEAIENGGEIIRPSWSSQNGYHSSYSPSTRRDNPYTRSSQPDGGKRRVAKVIGNVLPEERFGYIFPDPINGDQWRFAQEYRENIHEALGGIDPMGMKSGMTFAEVKSLYGKVAATAKQKCVALWNYGLCKILEMAISIEEQVFMNTYKQYMISTHPQAKKNMAMFQKTGMIPDDIVHQDYKLRVESGDTSLPLGVSGLIPNGIRKVLWKWTGPVFEQATRDTLDLSIVVRNMQELGVGSLEAMQFLFPDKDENEIKKLLGGVPFRFGREVTNWLGTLLSLQQQLSTVPDPMNPVLPLAASINLTPLIQQQLMTLNKELSYGSDFEPNNDISSPYLGDSGVFGGADANSGVGAPTGNAAGTNGGVLPSPVPITSSGYAAGLQPGYANLGTGTNQPIYGEPSLAGSAGSVTGSLLPEWTRLLPVSGGSVLSPNPAVPTGVSSGYGPVGPTIPTDLLGTNVGAQLYGYLPAAVEPSSTARNRGRRRSSTKGSSNK